jgi:hypothetical protein
MPFAMIDLDWLDGSEYHLFLLWLIPKISGTDGFNQLESGQLRFSRREVEMHFKIGSSRAGKLIEKGVEDGNIIPLGKHQKRKGCGEIYEAKGILRQCRFEPEPRLNQDQTKTEPTKPQETNELDAPLNQDQTKTEPRLNRLIDKTKKTIKNTAPKEPSKLEEILEWNDMDYIDVFWQVLKPFPAEKKTWPMTIAKVFMEAVRSGTEPDEIYAAALKLSKSTNPQYMPNAAKWMKEQGWRAYAVGQ